MALNCVMRDDRGVAIPLPHEISIKTYSGTNISLIIPDAPPTAASTAGGSGGIKKLKSSGTMQLTDQRLIFVAEPAKKSGPHDPSSEFESLSIPYRAVLSTRFEQPALGANYLSFEIQPTPDGHLTRGTQAELRFQNTPMFEFVSLLEKSRERVTFMERQNADDEEGLPSYTTPSESSTAGDIPIDNPPSYF